MGKGSDKNIKDLLSKILTLVFSIGTLLFVIFLVFSRTDYEKIERQMVKNAKAYIKENKIDVTNQEFVFIRDLNIESGAELCSKASGVIITNIAGSIKYYPYLKCIDYESKVLNNTKNYIELKGSEVALVNLNTLYFDEGYTKKRDDIKIEKVGEVPNEVGAYTINYVVTKDNKQKTIVKRIVIVSDVNVAIPTAGFDNKNEPNLVLKGEANIVLKEKEKYEEPGYVAYDYTDSYLTKKVKVDQKTISTDKVGNYTITYTVTNSKGKTTTVKRNISVVKELGDLRISLTTSEQGAAINESKIKVSVAGNGFEKLILPNDEELKVTIANYTATKNGTYTFKVIDKYGNELTKSIVVDNIDSKKPVGSCKLEQNGEENIFRVVAEDDSGIMGVDYIINGNETGYLTTTQYRIKEKILVADVSIRDVAGNSIRIVCPVENEDSTVHNYTFKYNSNKSTMACNSYTKDDKSNLEATLVKTISTAEYGTRAGVVAAARFLVGGLNYRVPYLTLKNKVIDPEQILGLYDKIGLNIANSNAWGCKVKGLVQGMNSETFIRWAFINAGVTLDDNYATVDTASNFGKIKPGDILLTSCGNCANKYSNYGLVIGVESNKIYVATFTTKGLVMTELTKGKLPKNGEFALVSLYSYKHEGNLTNMWKKA